MGEAGCNHSVWTEDEAEYIHQADCSLLTATGRNTNTACRFQVAFGCPRKKRNKQKTHSSFQHKAKVKQGALKRQGALKTHLCPQACPQLTSVFLLGGVLYCSGWSLGSVMGTIASEGLLMPLTYPKGCFCLGDDPWEKGFLTNREQLHGHVLACSYMFSQSRLPFCARIYGDPIYCSDLLL